MIHDGQIGITNQASILGVSNGNLISPGHTAFSLAYKNSNSLEQPSSSSSNSCSGSNLNQYAASSNVTSLQSLIHF